MQGDNFAGNGFTSSKPLTDDRSCEERVSEESWADCIESCAYIPVRRYLAAGWPLVEE